MGVAGFEACRRMSGVSTGGGEGQVPVSRPVAVNSSCTLRGFVCLLLLIFGSARPCLAYHVGGPAEEAAQDIHAQQSYRKSKYQNEGSLGG